MLFDEINKTINEIDGHVGYYFLDLVNNNSFSYNSNDNFLAASVIKFPILLSICKLISENKASLNDKILVNETDKVPGCGAIKFNNGNHEYDLDTLCHLMITISDNTATNVLINHFSIDELNKQFIELGFIKTRLNRIMFDSIAASKGLENYICLDEIGEALRRLYNHEFINDEMSDYILNTLKLQQINHKIPGYYNRKIDVAHKTGEDTNISNDVGIVYSSNPFIICFAGNDVDVSKWEIFMRETSKMLLDEYNK